jgi:hypothetical protein
MATPHDGLKLIVRDREGRPVEIPFSSIPKSLWPSKIFENPYWIYSPDRPVLEPLVKAYLEGRDLSPDGVRRLATYFLDYACHIAIMGYLFGGGQEQLEHNLPLIRRLRTMAKSASTKEDLHEMIAAGMEYALDPL